MASSKWLFGFVCVLVLAGSAVSGADTVLFRDDFTGVLEPGWTWVRENPATWQMTPTTLRIELEYGDLWSTWTNNCRNLLIRPAPTEDFLLEVHLNASLVASINQAHVLLYANDDNHLRFGLLNYQGALYVNHVHELGGTPQPQTSHAYGSSEVYLRIERQGGQATMSYSADGLVWLEHLTITSLGFDVTNVGLVAFDGSEPASASVAEYDYFTILAAPAAVREPAAGHPLLIVRGNPVRAGDATELEFTTPTPGQVSLRVFDLLGAPIATVMECEAAAGVHTARWSPDETRSAGIYFLLLEAGGSRSRARLLVLP